MIDWHQLVDLPTYAEFFLPYVIAALCGAALGLERELQRKPAGLRTNMLIAVGSALFTYASFELAGEGGDPSRVAAQIVTGVGFLGAGTIIRDRGENVIHGLTSAATVWMVAALGMLAGARLYGLALGGALLGLLILQALKSVENWTLRWYVHHTVTIEAEDREWLLHDVRLAFHRQRIAIARLDQHRRADGRQELRVEIDTHPRRAERVVLALRALRGIEQVTPRVA